MKNARYLLNHQSFCDSVRRCAPVVFVSPGNNNFFCYFCAEHGIGHLVSARQTGNRVAYSSQCKLRSRVHSLCVRQMVYLPPVDMQCDSIFHMARGERWSRGRRGRNQLEPAAWKFEYGKNASEYHTACHRRRHRHSDSIKNSIQLVEQCAHVECAVCNVHQRRVVVFGALLCINETRLKCNLSALTT